MFATSEVAIVDVEHVRLGDFGFFEAENSNGLVGKIRDDELVVVSVRQWKKENYVNLRAINGFAAVIRDTYFAVDIHSATRMGSPPPMPGHLVIQGAKVFILAADKNGKAVGVEVGVAEDQGCRAAVAFSNWRLVKQQGDQAVTLCGMEIN